MRLLIPDFISSVTLGVLFMLTPFVVGATPAVPEEGLDYQIVRSAQPANTGKKIEVAEFFWYDCPHCNVMLPLIETWAKHHQKSIIFKRIPVARTEGAKLQQQLYYALETMGKVEALHSQIFYAIHDEKVSLKTVEQMADFLVELGIEKNRFLKIINSDAVMKKVQRAQQLTANYGVDSVPTIVINGQYVTSATILGSNQADVLPVVDYLLSKSRQNQRQLQ